MEKIKVICGTILVALLIITVGGVFISNGEYKVIFDMDDNSLEAVKKGLEIQITPTCEEGCLYIQKSWLGFDPSELEYYNTKCIEYCGNMNKFCSIGFSESKTIFGEIKE